jgi:hypothetical protein
VVVGVVACQTSFGVTPDSMPDMPKTVTVEGAPAGAAMSGYSNGFVTVVGPARWSCHSQVGADGNVTVTVFPNDQGPLNGKPFIAQDGQQIEAVIPFSLGVKSVLVCPLFPQAAATAYAPCPSAPAGEFVTRRSETVVEFEDPPGVAGDGNPSGGSYPALGVMVYDQATESRYGAEESCTLPEAQHAVCTAVLQDFVVRHGHP